MNSSIQYVSFKKLLLTFCILIVLIMFCTSAYAQLRPENPPKPINVTNVGILQQLNFGTFCYTSSSGNIIVDEFNARSTSEGDITLISSIFHPAIFYVEAIDGTLITIINGPDALLHGSNGGTLTLKLGGSEPKSPFIATGVATGVDKMVRKEVKIGGMLTFGSSGANPAGIYNGTFSVTFIQQ